MLEGRIQDLENKLSTAEIINPTELQRDGRVVFGVIVTFIDLNTDEQFKYQIVEDEANIPEGKISYVSPIARALIGKIEDDITEFDIPSGKRSPDCKSRIRSIDRQKNGKKKWLRVFI